jgi:hypothetical protein
MTSWDGKAYQKKVFDAIVRLIQKRDPSLGEDELKREALSLMEEHVRAAPMPFLNHEQPRLKRDEWERLQRQAKTLANKLQKLSFESKIQLRYLCKQLPDLNRLQLDLEDFSRALREGLKKRRSMKHRPTDFTKKDLVEEAINIFEKATGISLDELSDPNSRHSKKIKNKLTNFVEIYLPNKNMYTSHSALNRYITRLLHSA